jgi:hypothetical protein
VIDRSSHGQVESAEGQQPNDGLRMAETRGDAHPCAAHNGEHLRQYEIAKVKLAREVLSGGGTGRGGLRIATR